jgi:ribonuclease VapC
MVLVTSAVVEILLDGPRSLDLLRKLDASPAPKTTGPTVIYEATVVLAGKQSLAINEAERLVRSLLAALKVSVTDVTDHTASIALTPSPDTARAGILQN